MVAAALLPSPPRSGMSLRTSTSSDGTRRRIGSTASNPSWIRFGPPTGPSQNRQIRRPAPSSIDLRDRDAQIQPDRQPERVQPRSEIRD